MPEPILPPIPVRCVYLSPDNQEVPETEFEAVCLSVPRTGETVVSQAGSRKVIAHNVYHTSIKNEAFDAEMFSSATSRLEDGPCRGARTEG